MKKIILLSLLSFILTPLISAPVVLTLDGLMSTMRINNSEIIELQQHLIQGKLDVKQTKASRFGSLEASLGLQYMANPPLNPFVTNMGNTFFDSSLTYTLPLFTWGKINASVDLYKSLRIVKEAQLREKMGTLSNEVQSLISTLHHINTIISLLEEQRAIGDRLLSIAKNSLEVGVITSLDYKERQGELLSIDEAMIEIQFQKDDVITKIEQLSGLEDISQSLITDPTKLSDIISYAKHPLDELIEMGQRSVMPIISGLENAEEASRALYNVAKGNLYGKPDFALQVSLGYSGPRLPFIEIDWYGQDDYTFNISIGMKSNLFDGRKAITEAKKAESEILIQKAKTLDGKNTIAAQIKKYRNEILTYNQLHSVLNQKISILNEKTLILENEVKLGFSNEAALLSHQMISIQESIKHEQTLLKMKIAYFSLLHITNPY